MNSLDDREFVLRLDPKGMYDLTCAFPEQVARAREIAASAALPSWSARPDLVVLTGMGGSAAGGDFVRALFDAGASVPFLVNRDYEVPGYVSHGALVFACSHSGNTEETIAAYRTARHQGASLIVITSGGQLAEMAREDGFPLVTIPAGQPPRTALGYLLVPVAIACERMGLIPSQDYETIVEELRQGVEAWKLEVSEEENEAKQIANFLYGKLPIFYGLGGWQGVVANRWKGQLNENAKVMAFANAFPELNHNEILGWVEARQQGVERWAVLILEDGLESAKMQERARVTTELIRGVADVRRVRARGSMLLAKMLSLALLGDFVSLYLAALVGVDPENIDSINVLKAALARI